MSDFVRRKSANRRLATVFVGSKPLDPANQSLELEIDTCQARLIVTCGSQKGHEYMLGRDKTTIGRGEEADVMIDESSASRRHAQLECRSDNFYLRDLGSTNGTYFDGLLHGAEKCLSDGDCFQIGKTGFLFRV